VAGNTPRKRIADKVHAALGPGRHCLEGPVEVALTFQKQATLRAGGTMWRVTHPFILPTTLRIWFLEALKGPLLRDLGQMASLQVEKVFAEMPKLTVTVRPL
jgi:hypothetical protein